MVLPTTLKGPEGTHVATTGFETVGFQEFAPNAESVADARRFVASVLESYGCTADQVFMCQLVADELATNALNHAGSLYSVAVEVSGSHVRIAVRDDSRALPEVREAPLDALSGRGLAIVAGTAEQWGSESLGHGKEIWADVHQDGERWTGEHDG
jgi:anti-sigma regulatory factor (Ser/Thr protein kinase)